MQKNSFDWNVVIWVIYFPTLLLSVMRGLVLLTVPLYVSLLGVSFAYVGIATSAMSLGTTFSDLPSSLVIEGVGQKKTIIISFGIWVMAFVGLFFSYSFNAVVLSMALLGVGIALWYLSRHYYIAARIPYNYRGRTSAIMGAIERIGLFVGPILAAFSLPIFGYNLTYAEGAIIILVMLTIYVFLSNRIIDLPFQAQGTEPEAISGRLKEISTIIFLVALVNVVRYGRYFLMPLYGKHILSLDDTTIGLTVGFSAFLDVVSAYPAGLLIDRRGRALPIGLSFAIFGLGLGLMSFSTNLLGFIIAVTIIGIGNGLGSGTMVTLGADIGSGYRGKIASRFLATWRFIGDVGSAIGPLSMGFLASLTGLGFSSLVLAVISLGVAFALPTIISLRPTS